MAMKSVRAMAALNKILLLPILWTEKTYVYKSFIIYEFLLIYLWLY